MKKFKTWKKIPGIEIKELCDSINYTNGIANYKCVRLADFRAYDERTGTDYLCLKHFKEGKFVKEITYWVF